MPVNSNSSCNQNEEAVPKTHVSMISLNTTIIGAVTILIITVLFGNWLVIASILKFKRMRNVQNILLFSLSICDMLLGAVIVPITLAYELLGYWPLGRAGCKVFLLLDIALCTSSIWTLCMISINRYMAIKLGARYRLHNTVRNGIGMVISIWMFSTCVCLPAFSLANSQMEATDCSHSEEIWFILYSISFSFYIPLAIMCITYGMVVWRFKEIMRKTKVKSALLRKEKKMHILVGVTMAAFVTCWLPFFVVYTVQALCPNCCIPSLLVKFCEWFGYVNCALNPIIYSITKEEFRNAFKALLSNKPRVGPAENRSISQPHSPTAEDQIKMENPEGQ